MPNQSKIQDKTFILTGAMADLIDSPQGIQSKN